MRSSPSLSVWLGSCLATALLSLTLAVQAATPQPLAAQAVINALAQASAAVVGIEVTAAEGARSAETLGARRRGSGVVIGADGLILTIGYLILEADSVQVVTQDNKTVPARALAYDQATGFGLVKTLLPLRGIQPVKLGSLTDLTPGAMLLAASGGEDADVGMTQLVSKRAFSGYWEYHIEAALFTSPPIGNHSGAPLFNQRGELVGIGSLLVMDAAGERKRQPGNMFVPVDLLKPIMDEMQKDGSSKASHRPWLGLTSSDQAGRIEVVRVNKESPAQDAGMAPGDLVLAVDGTKVSTLEAFYKKIWDRASADTPVELTVLRGADITTIKLQPVDRMSTMRKPGGI